MAEKDMSDRPRRPQPAVESSPAKSDLPLGEWISKAIDQARGARDEPAPRDTASSAEDSGRTDRDAAAPTLGADARDAAQRAAAASGLSIAEWIGRAVQDAAAANDAGVSESPTPDAADSPQAGDPLGAEAMRAARQAADLSGLSLNQWISGVIRDAQADEAPEATPDPFAPDEEETQNQHEDQGESMRRAANRAAAAAGMPLGDWLRSAVEEASAESDRSDDRAADDGVRDPVAPQALPSADPGPDRHQDITRLARYLPLDALQPGPFQAREDMNPAEIVTLSESIRAKGVLQPILVRPQPGRTDRYHVIAGERRWRAARMAGLEEVPTIVLDISDREAMQIALVENLVRRDLNPIEEAQGFRRLIDEYAHTQDELAELVGRSRSHVANMLRLLRLPEDVQSLLREGELSASQGRALVNAPDASDLARQVVERDLNVRQTEALVQRSLGEAKKPEPPATATDLNAVERNLSARLGMRVRINMRGERGTLSVRFKGQEGLDTLLERLDEKK
jgi:ParB family chromosome partitioning protein